MLGPDYSVIFDLDGTLVDTAPDLCHALNHVLENAGKAPVTLDVMRSFVGQGARKMIEQGLIESGIDPDPAHFEGYIQQFLAYYRTNIAVESKPFPGVIDAIETLRGEGVKCAVCTNKSEALSLQLLEHLDLMHLFSAVLGSDSVPAYKPDPGHLLSTIARINGDPQKSLMVGDSITDVKTARAANIPIIVVDFGYTKIKPADLGGDHLMSHYDELGDATRKLLLP